MTPGADIVAHLEAARQLLSGGADADELYRRWFHDEQTTTARWPSAARYLSAMIDADRFRAGWRVLEPASPGPRGHLVPYLVVDGRGRRRLVAPPQIVPTDRGDLAPGPGAEVRVDPLATGLSAGFWHIWSTGWQDGAPDGIVRLYLLPRPSELPTLVARVASVAPPDERWSMKALTGLHHDGRRDRALLYLDPSTPRAEGWVAEVIAAATAASDPCVVLPPLVEALTPTVGLAIDPGGERSFGQVVCSAVASATAHASDPPRFALEARAALSQVAGLDHHRPPDGRP